MPGPIPVSGPVARRIHGVGGAGEFVIAHLSISIPPGEIPEGSTAQFSVTLSHSLPTGVTVGYGVVPGTADATDYAEPPIGAVAFAANSSAGATQTIAVPINQDMLSEGEETFTVMLGAVSGSTASRVLVDPDRASALATIAESDRVTIQLSGPDTVNEGSASTYTVSLSPRGVVPASDLTVHFATANGSATAGSDYTAASGTLTFTPQDYGARTFTVQTTEDALDEPGESFEVSIANPVNRQGPAPRLRTDASTVTTTIIDAQASGPDAGPTPEAVLTPGGEQPTPTPTPGGLASSLSRLSPLPWCLLLAIALLMAVAIRVILRCRKRRRRAPL